MVFDLPRCTNMVYFLHVRLSLKSLIFIYGTIFTFLAIGANAQQFPDSSCEELIGETAEGQPRNYGNVQPRIIEAVTEARLIASTALQILKDAFAWEGSAFDRVRATQSYAVFQGPIDDSRATRDRIDAVLGKLLIFCSQILT